MFLTSDVKYTFLSSSVVREMARYGADLTGFVPDEIKEEIEEKSQTVEDKIMDNNDIIESAGYPLRYGHGGVGRSAWK